ncbi:type VI secretion system tip protein VgrG, partial [Pantoea ananatis]|uniref:type VI secretion system Vgr family protein n=2 Tax=Pantoea ananas TaxID=553 RepID=UPI000DB17688
RHNIDFRVLPAAVTYRAKPETPWPKTHGPQTAKVVGPKGESIWTDKYGRVKVKFHWDRLAKGDDTSSCWVRVSSAWAGQGFGGVQIPRVGDEVVVDFINGDPDRPIVTGRVYNEARMPPWDLPGDATRMGFMTRSKDGHQANASYLFFEDKPGGELLNMHAEKDMNISVENDKNVFVDGNRTTIIKKKQQDNVVGSVTLTYEDTWNTTVTNGVNNVFNGGEDTYIQKGRKLEVSSGGEEIKINGGSKKEINGDEDYRVVGNKTHHVTGKVDETIDSGLEQTINNGVLVNINSGSWEQHVNNGTILIKSPMNITLQSETNVDIQAPKSSYTIAGHKEAITGNSFSLTGFSESITAAAVDAKHTSIAHNVISMSHKTFEAKNSAMSLNQIGSVITSGALHWSSKALTLFL